MNRRDDAPPCPTIFVGNLSYDLTDQDVIDHFSQVGPVKHVRLVAERETGKPRGFGFVEFFDTPTAESAIRNLSGKDFKGRPVRIVYADGGPGDFPRRDFDGPPRGGPMGGGGPGMGGPGGMGGRQPLRDRVVGGDLAYHASMGAAAALGAPAPPGAPADAITHLLARRSRAELYDYLAQMQGLLQRNPGQARQILGDNPQLAKALFQMQVILGMVANPLGDVAPRGVAPPNLMPRPGQDAAPPHMGGPPGPMGGPPDMGPPPHGMMEGPPPHMGGPPPHMGMQGPPGPMGRPPGPMGGPPGPMAPPMQPQQPPYMQPPPMEQPGYGGPPAQPYMQPPPQQPYMQPPPQQQPYMQPPPAQQPVDPRLAAAGAPRPMMSMAQTAPPVAPMAPPPAMGAGLTSEQQQALLQQVMSLTPEQIELLPPAQKAQVQALQQSLRGQ